MRVSSEETRRPRSSAISKRIFDLAIAIPALVLLSPVIATLAAMVAMKLGRPILFRQRRPGLDGRIFTILKFRTMLDARAPDGSVLPDADRLPPFGRWLRSTSLDELPELWNVIKGEMSLVGPRPLLPEYLELYTPEQMRRHEVRPGITGWAQVNGRNALSWEAKFELDNWYRENRTFWLDVRILFLTVRKVFARHGVTADDEATMPRFTGTGRRGTEEAHGK